MATCDATKFRGGDLGKMEQKCSRSRDNWLWSVTLTWNSGHHIYMSTRMNCKTHGFLANPENRTVETSSKTHGLLRALSPCFCPMFFQDCSVEKLLGSSLVFYTNKARILAISGSEARTRRRFAAPQGRQITGMQFDNHQLMGVFLEKLGMEIGKCNGRPHI